MGVRIPTVEEIRSWSVTVDVQAAGRAFGLGRDQSYRLAREGHFPVPVLRLGRYLRVTRSSILRALDIDDTSTSGRHSAETSDVIATIADRRRDA